MGRCVSSPTDARVTFDSVDIEDHDEWLDYTDGLADRAVRLWPSMFVDTGWLGREDRYLARNGFAYFGVSEYCGTVAIWLAPVEVSDYEANPVGWEALRDRWLDQAEAKLEANFGRFRRVGRFSNGGAVYSPISSDDRLEDNLGDRPGPVVIAGQLCTG